MVITVVRSCSTHFELFKSNHMLIILMMNVSCTGSMYVITDQTIDRLICMLILFKSENEYNRLYIYIYIYIPYFVNKKCERVLLYKITF